MSNHRLHNHQIVSHFLNLLTIAAITLCVTATAAAQTITLISSLDYSFSGLIFDSAGNLYGTTSTGGNFIGDCNTWGCGTVFELSPTSSGG